MPQSHSTDEYQTPPPNNRRGSLQIVEAEIFVKQSNSQLFRATLSDLSVSGFKMTSYTDLDHEKPVHIRLPGIQTLSASIKWADYEDYGCEFSDELHPAVLEHLITRLRGFQQIERAIPPRLSYHI
ncbi:PilZ domain-containing protein [Parasphingorhabdus cellanae]|uniref:PilZ domain-containing protein n=1 Tax=Parasphingorhabdus cellanae TaxID=2806553 RepID=A0ABX7T891_9SPHN|nr:PilZ domain-containing protein [Parasphingorhabdus cellanae]QTD56702.1 PilZ domain-containing protein [Parasphingorhabdus cellanae]